MATVQLENPAALEGTQLEKTIEGGDSGRHDARALQTMISGGGGLEKL